MHATIPPPKTCYSHNTPHAPNPPRNTSYSHNASHVTSPLPTRLIRTTHPTQPPSPLSQHLLFAQQTTRNHPPSSQQLLFAQHTARNLHRHLIVPRNSRSLSASTCQRYEASETHARLLSLRTDRVFPSYYWDPLALPLLMLCVCLGRGLWNGNMGGGFIYLFGYCKSDFVLLL